MQELDHHYINKPTIKIYLDDERETPEGYTRVYWADEAIELLKTHHADHLSLDHDLGDDERSTGYDVLLWIEEAVMTNDYIPPTLMSVHSANPSARQKMENAILTINNFYSEKLLNKQTNSNPNIS